MRVIAPEPVSEKALVRKIATVRSRARWTIGARGIGWLISAVCGLALAASLLDRALHLNDPALRAGLLAALVVMVGISLTFTGCGGPGAYKAVLTPAGTYPITITVSGSNNFTETTVVNYVVTAPGMPGQE